MKALGHPNADRPINHTAGACVQLLLARRWLEVNISSCTESFKPALYYAMQPNNYDLHDVLSLQLRKDIVHDMLCRSGFTDFIVDGITLSPPEFIHNYSTSLDSYRGWRALTHARIADASEPFYTPEIGTPQVPFAKSKL